MNIYLPIAELSMNIWLLLGVGAAVGFLAGLFGIGGGFIMTPLLILLGIPPPVAVGTGALPILASSVSGALTQNRRGNLDMTMGWVLIAGGLVGSMIGVETVRILRRQGQFDLAVALAYVTFLGSVGALMLLEWMRTLSKEERADTVASRRRSTHVWLHRLPLKMRFRASKLYVSAVPVLVIGAFIGFMGAVMGIGGGFVIVPALIYLLRVPTNIAVGTSLFQAVFVAAGTAVMQSAVNQSVDATLAMLLVIGGVVGAQFGARAGLQLRAEQLRLMLVALILMVALRVGLDLILKPERPYSLQTLVRGLQ